MNTNKVPTQFETDTRFELTPVPAAPVRGLAVAELEELKNRLLRDLLPQAPTPSHAAAFRQAANDAAALVWLTPYPLLLLPTLLEEKARLATQQIERQQLIRRRSLTMRDLVE